MIHTYFGKALIDGTIQVFRCTKAAGQPSIAHHDDVRGTFPNTAKGNAAAAEMTYTLNQEQGR